MPKVMLSPKAMYPVARAAELRAHSPVSPSNTRTMPLLTERRRSESGARTQPLWYQRAGPGRRPAGGAWDILGGPPPRGLPLDDDLPAKLARRHPRHPAWVGPRA